LFQNVVFAGGGNRCFWQAGFWLGLTAELELKPATIASVSAGSAISCALFSGQIEATLEHTKRVMATNPKNRYLRHLFTEKPVHPHAALYRKIIHAALDSDALIRLKKGPTNRILLARKPKWLGPKSAVLAGLGAYQVEKHLFQPVHPKMGRRLGFKSEFINANDCEDVSTLADLILGSSCTPPFTPLMYRQDKPVLDGGLVDNVPLHGVDQLPGNTLVMLTRPYKKLPTRERITYVQPSQPVAASSWDYTSPENVQLTYDQGRSDAAHFLRTLCR